MVKIKLLSIIPVDFYYHLSVIAGVCPFIYDRKNGVVRQSLFLEIYSSIVHGSCILLLVPFLILAHKNNDLNRKGISQIVEVVNMVIKALSIALSMSLFNKNRLKFQRFSNEILRLNTTTFKVEPKSEDEKIHFWLLKIVVLKIAVTAMLGFVHIGTFLNRFKVMSWQITGVFVCNTGMFMFQQYGIFYFYTAVGFVCKFYQMSNRQLLELCKNYEVLTIIKRKASHLEKISQMIDRVDELSLLYKELYDLHDFLKNVYEIQVVSTMIVALLNNVTYWFGTYTTLSVEPFNVVAFVTHFALTLGMYLDAYLMFAVCEKGSRLWKAARDIFGRFNTLKSIDYRFDRSVWICRLYVFC